MAKKPTGRPPGQPAIPIERKRRTGTANGRQSKAVEVERATLAPPDDLGPSGFAAWEHVAHAARGWLAQSDTPLLRLLCDGFDRRDLLLQRISNEGEILYTDKGYAYAHPAVGMLTSLERQMTAWMAALGLSPADRSRLGLAEVKRASKLEELRSKRASK